MHNIIYELGNDIIYYVIYNDICIYTYIYIPTHKPLIRGIYLHQQIRTADFYLYIFEQPTSQNQNGIELFSKVYKHNITMYVAENITES